MAEALPTETSRKDTLEYSTTMNSPMVATDSLISAKDSRLISTNSPTRNSPANARNSPMISRNSQMIPRNSPMNARDTPPLDEISQWLLPLSQRFESPSNTNTQPTLMRELANHKTIVNTFKIAQKRPFVKANSQLYKSIKDTKSSELYAKALVAFNDQEYEDCIRLVNRAMMLEPNNVKFYHLQGEAHIFTCDFKSAIMIYKKLCILEPENEPYYKKLAFIYFLHGQSFFDEKLFVDALECFTKAAEMQPDNAGYQARSIATLAALKRHRECLDLINQRLEVDDNNPDLFIVRARLYLVFSNPTLSFYDVQKALLLDGKNGDASFMQKTLTEKAENLKIEAMELNVRGEVTEAIKKLTLAFATNPSKLEYGILRASTHRHNLDFDASVDDLVYVMKKDGISKDLYKQAQAQLLLTFNDFAVDCFNKGMYEDALKLLEKAIQGEKNNPTLYVNRGDCFYKLGNLHYALLDYEQAFELDQSSNDVMLRLATVYHDFAQLEFAKKKFARAEEYFTLAIARNPFVAEYFHLRARSRLMQEKVEESKVDLLSSLHINPENSSTYSLLSNLFPGKKVKDVLSTELGCLVKQALKQISEESLLNTNSKGYLESNIPLPPIDKSRGLLRTNLQKVREERKFNHSLIQERKKANEVVEVEFETRPDLTTKIQKLSTLLDQVALGCENADAESTERWKMHSRNNVR